MKQRPRDPDRAIGCREALVGVERSPERISALANGGQRFGESVGGQTGLVGQVIHRVGRHDRALRLGILEIRELARDLGNARVKDRPRHPAGLGQHGLRRLGITLGLVPEPAAFGVHLNPALGHHRPGDQDPVRVRDVAVSLIRAQVIRRGAERLAPADRVALVADMAEIDRIADLGHELAHHLAIAAKAVAGEDQGLAADPFDRPVGQHGRDAADVTGLGREKLLDPAFRDQGNLLGLERGAQPVDQFPPGPRRKPVHPAAGMAGIAEIPHDGERQAVAVRQPVDDLGRPFGQCAHKVRVVPALGLVHDVVGKETGVVLDPRVLLHLGPGGRDQPGRQGGRSRRHRVRLEDQDLFPALVRRERGDHARRAGPDDQHLGLEIETFVRRRQDIGHDPPSNRRPRSRIASVPSLSFSEVRSCIRSAKAALDPVAIRLS